MSSAGAGTDQARRSPCSLPAQASAAGGRAAGPPRPAAVSGSSAGQPQRRGGRAGPRALQADLAQVQLGGGEVGVGRVVQVGRPPPGRGRAPRRSRRAAGRACAGRRRPCRSRRSRGTAPRPTPSARSASRREEAAVGGIDVHPRAVAARASGDDLVDRVDRAQAGGACGRHDGADRPRSRRSALQRVKVHPCRRRRPGTAIDRDAEQRAHPARACSAPARCRRSPGPGWISRATQSASRLAIVPLLVRWPRCAGSKPNIRGQLRR